MRQRPRVAFQAHWLWSVSVSPMLGPPAVAGGAQPAREYLRLKGLVFAAVSRFDIRSLPLFCLVPLLLAARSAWMPVSQLKMSVRQPVPGHSSPNGYCNGDCARFDCFCQKTRSIFEWDSGVTSGLCGISLHLSSIFTARTRQSKCCGDCYSASSRTPRFSQFDRTYGPFQSSRLFLGGTAGYVCDAGMFVIGDPSARLAGAA